MNSSSRNLLEPPAAAFAVGDVHANQPWKGFVMPSQDAKRPSEQARRLSRRAMLRGAATAGAAGLAVTAIGSAASPAFAATDESQRHSAPQVAGSAPQVAGSIVVHVRDAKSGDIEVFSGTSKTRVRDKDLAARIARAIG
jgi:hypothetical protein